MNKEALGQAGLRGWRARVGEAVAQPVANHSPLSAEQVRAVVGALFFALSLVYVAGTIRRLVGRR